MIIKLITVLHAIILLKRITAIKYAIPKHYINQELDRYYEDEDNREVIRSQCRSDKYYESESCECSCSRCFEKCCCSYVLCPNCMVNPGLLYYQTPVVYIHTPLLYLLSKQKSTKANDQVTIAEPKKDEENNDNKKPNSVEDSNKTQTIKTTSGEDTKPDKGTTLNKNSTEITNTKTTITEVTTPQETTATVSETTTEKQIEITTTAESISKEPSIEVTAEITTTPEIISKEPSIEVTAEITTTAESIPQEPSIEVTAETTTPTPSKLKVTHCKGFPGCLTRPKNHYNDVLEHVRKFLSTKLIRKTKTTKPWLFFTQTEHNENPQIKKPRFGIVEIPPDVAEEMVTHLDNDEFAQRLKMYDWISKLDWKDLANNDIKVLKK